MCEGFRGSTKEYQKLDTETQDGQFPRQSIEQDWNVFRNLRLTLYALAALSTSSQGAQLAQHDLQHLNMLNDLPIRVSTRSQQSPLASQTANEARLEIEYYAHTRTRVPILI